MHRTKIMTSLNTSGVVPHKPYIKWEAIEELCATTPDLPDCIPQNVRQWDTFIKQYERACDLVSGKWEPHYKWNTKEEFREAVNDQFFMGKGYKNSIYECYMDVLMNPTLRSRLFYNVNWNTVKTAILFTRWSVILSWTRITHLPLLPKKVGGYLDISNNSLRSLQGCPEYVGESFHCDYNNLKSLKGAPKYVGLNFNCMCNKLTTLDYAPVCKGIFEYSSNNIPDVLLSKYNNQQQISRIVKKCKSIFGY